MDAWERQQDDQYKKLHELGNRIGCVEAEVREVKADLFGVTGQNGLRGEVREIKRLLRWLIGLVLGVPPALFALQRLLEAL